MFVVVVIIIIINIVVISILFYKKIWDWIKVIYVSKIYFLGHFLLQN